MPQTLLSFHLNYFYIDMCRVAVLVYLKHLMLTSFAFDLVDENIVAKHISTNNSYGHDGISMKLL